MNHLSILAISASAAIRKSLKAQLDSMDFVEHVGSIPLDAKEGKRLLQDRSPDVVVIDLLHEQENALDLVKTINKLSSEKPCLLVALHEELEPQTILFTMQNGVKEFVPFREIPEALENSLKKHFKLLNRFAPVESKPVKPRGKLLAIFSPKGGSGASTLAFNTAYEIHRLVEQPVAFLELDQTFSNVIMMTNLQPEFCLGNLSKNSVKEIDEQLLRKLISPHESGIDFMVACKSILEENEMIPVTHVKAALDYLLEQHSYVIVDLPSHTLDSYHQLVVELSDMVLLVSTMDVPAMYRTLQYLELAKQYLDESKLKLVLNRSDLEGAYGISNKKLEQEFNYPVYARLSEDWELNIQANSLGKPIGALEPYSDLAKEYRKLAGQITGTDFGQKSARLNSSWLEKLSSFKMQAGLAIRMRGDAHNVTG